MSPGEPHKEAGMNRLRLLATVIPAALLPFSASLVYFVLLAGTSVAMILYAATKVFTVVWPFFAAVVIEGHRFRRGRCDWRKHLAAVPLGLVTGLLIGGAIVALYVLTPLGDYAREYAGDIHARVAGMGIARPVRYIAFCTFLCVLHPLIEEFFWRWYVFGRLIRVIPQSAAYFFASLGFAAHHYVLLGCYFPAWGAFVFGTAVGVGGALWCWMYRCQGTLVGAWVSHALVDVGICLVGYRLIFS